jgi:hypothetical protein
MAGTSRRTRVIAARVPLEMITLIDARGVRSDVLLASLEAYLGPVDEKANFRLGVAGWPEAIPA